MQDPTPAPTVVRYAIYSRQSVEDPTDNGFTSLDAQRDAGEAYVATMKQEGRVALPDRYDDGGFTGGNTERPALQRLMQDVADGKVDTIIVYKIDRLSRSLLDFLKLIEMFEQHRVAFVAVTQQINSATSAGKLMLHILASFASYERALISERTSDKMCAARRKGKYTGGPAILGYRVDYEKKRLVVDPAEAQMVRELFDLYLQHCSLLKVSQIANSRGWRTKRWVRRDGQKREGGVWDKAKLQRIVTCITYTGHVEHKGEILPGEHEAIIDQETFDRVQAQIQANGNGSSATVRNKHNALLRGLLRCGQCGAAMSHHYAQKGTRLYRYYVCTTKQKQGLEACSTPSLPAQEIEDFVVDQIRKLARDPELAKQVFEEASRQQQASIPPPKAERTRLQRQRQHNSEEIKRLVGAIAATDKPSPSVTEGLSQLEESVAIIDRRLGEIDREVAAIEKSSIDPEHVAATLAEFTDLWDVLYLQERTRIVHLLVESVSFKGDTDIQIVFSAEVRRTRPMS